MLWQCEFYAWCEMAVRSPQTHFQSNALPSKQQSSYTSRSKLLEHVLYCKKPNLGQSPSTLPLGEDWPDRLVHVLFVVYVVFTSFACCLFLRRVCSHLYVFAFCHIFLYAVVCCMVLYVSTTYWIPKSRNNKNIMIKLWTQTSQQTKCTVYGFPKKSTRKQC